MILPWCGCQRMSIQRSDERGNRLVNVLGMSWHKFCRKQNICWAWWIKKAYALMPSEVEHAFPSTSPKAMIMLRPPRLVGAEAASPSKTGAAWLASSRTASPLKTMRALMTHSDGIVSYPLMLTITIKAPTWIFWPLAWASAKTSALGRIFGSSQVPFANSPCFSELMASKTSGRSFHSLRSKSRWT